jgi:AraC-like DNA-binding protein
MNSANSLIIILLYGSLIAMSYLWLTNPGKVNKRANLWLGLSFFVWSTFWLEEILSIVDINVSKTLLVYILRLIQFPTPVCFYFCVCFFTNPTYRYSIKDFKYAILPLIYTGVLTITFYGNIENKKGLKILLLAMILLQVSWYVVKAYFNIRRHQKRIVLFSSNTKEIDLSWLEYIIIMVGIMCFTVGIYNISFYGSPPNIYINLLFLIACYFITYYSNKQKEIYPIDEYQRKELLQIPDQVEDDRKKLIPDEEVEEIKKRLAVLMQEQRPYLESDLNLIKLSELLSITPHQLSYVLNKGFKENFFLFVNSYRVEKAKELLLTWEKTNLSILGVAYESGFNSKTSFNTTFKKITGQTPSEFKKISSGL